jgi:hypothetical protein
MNTTETTVTKNVSMVVHIIATREPLPNNQHLWLHNSHFVQRCHNTKEMWHYSVIKHDCNERTRKFQAEYQAVHCNHHKINTLRCQYNLFNEWMCVAASRACDLLTSDGRQRVCSACRYPLLAFSPFKSIGKIIAIRKNIKKQCAAA